MTNSKIKPKTQKRYGWRRDLPDYRDIQFKVPEKLNLPSSYDLRSLKIAEGHPIMPQVYNQGQLGSCTANAIAAAIEWDRRKQKITDFVPSRLFIYYYERFLEGTVDSDSGAEIRDGIKVVNSYGVCPETRWPYSDTGSAFTDEPNYMANSSAKLHKSLQYQSVDGTNADAIKAAIVNHVPVVFGFTVYDAFESDGVAKTGVLDMPGKNESVLGGHAVLIVGYDDTSSRFIVRNSWGADWGQEGYFTMPYEYVTNANLASDFWAIGVVE